MSQTIKDTQYKQVADTIRQQIGFWNFAAVGARDFLYGSEERGSLSFHANILPFTKTGKRSGCARIMDVKIICTFSDTYTVTVTYKRAGEIITHYTASNIYADQIGRVILALDYDGEEVTNPRYWEN